MFRCLSAQKPADANEKKYLYSFWTDTSGALDHRVNTAAETIYSILFHKRCRGDTWHCFSNDRRPLHPWKHEENAAIQEEGGETDCFSHVDTHLTGVSTKSVLRRGKKTTVLVTVVGSCLKYTEAEWRPSEYPSRRKTKIWFRWGLKSGTNGRPVFSRINSPPLPSTQRRSLAGFLLCRSKLLQPLSGFAPFTLTFSHAESVQSVCVREAGGRERGGISYSLSVCLPVCLRLISPSTNTYSSRGLYSLRLPRRPITIQPARWRRKCATAHPCAKQKTLTRLLAEGLKQPHEYGDLIRRVP